MRPASRAAATFTTDRRDVTESGRPRGEKSVISSRVLPRRTALKPMSSRSPSASLIVTITAFASSPPLTETASTAPT